MTRAPAESTLQLEYTVELGAPPDAVFALLTDHKALPTWVPLLRRVEVDGQAAGGVDTVRILHPWLGPAGEERIVEHDPPLAMSYSATDHALRGLYTQHLARITCTPSACGTTLRWTVKAHPAARAWRRVAARILFGWALRRSLRNLRARFPTAH
jgi:uncharacterized protein YndB with AHSA1/START domain